MTDTQPDHDCQTDDHFKATVGRRTFIAVGGGISATMLAGCTSESSPDGSNDDTQTDGSTETAQDGNFRLLISDMPADIEDFDRLDVSFDTARIFDGGDDKSEGGDDQSDDADESNETDDGDDEDPSEAETETEAETEAANEDSETDTENEDSEADTENEDSEADTDNDVERKRGFYILDLQDATVDLTQVINDKAMSVFEGKLSDGTYEKIELHVSEVEGIVDGEQAEVKVPSEKLQITHPFEIRADDPVDFVFDINVVKRGQEDSYNLKPVISKSGVAGNDVDVEEIDDEGEDEEENDGAENTDSDDGEQHEEDGKNASDDPDDGGAD